MYKPQRRKEGRKQGKKEGKKKRIKKNYKNNQITINKKAISTYLSIITLYINGLNAPTK